MRKLSIAELTTFKLRKRYILTNNLDLEKATQLHIPSIFLLAILKKNFMTKNHVLGVFIYLSKAFDTIDHSKLLSKLNNYGIRGNVIELTKSYLSFDYNSQANLCNFIEIIHNTIYSNCKLDDNIMINPNATDSTIHRLKKIHYYKEWKK